MIDIQGNQFLVNGVVRPYVMRTSFCLVGHYQKGNRDKGKRWLDRVKAQGFDGVRVFMENQDWFIPGDNPVFFGNPAWTTEARAFPDTYSGPWSQMKLVPGYDDFVFQLSQDLMERELVAEGCCVATVKGRIPEWTSHGLNRFAQMFADLFPDPQSTPWLHECVNEWDAHSEIEEDEAGRFGGRWRRGSDDPSHHNYPGSTIGMSAGGQWEPGYADGGMTHVNLHPPRGSDWYGGFEIAGANEREPISVTCPKLRADADGRPVAFNETVHYMTPEEWTLFIDQLGIHKWIGLSTTNHGQIVQYTDDVLKSGVSICIHDRVGMSTDPDGELTPLEEAMAEYLGGVPVPPAKRRMFGPIIENAYLDILGRQPDDDGWSHYNDLMKQGMSEANMRESLIRSAEYATKNPE